MVGDNGIRFWTCKSCGTAEDISVSTTHCPGCGVKITPMSDPKVKPSIAAREKESYFDLAIAYMRGDPELTSSGAPGEDNQFYHFLKFWDRETSHFRRCIGSVFRAAPQFKREKIRAKKGMTNAKPKS